MAAIKQWFQRMRPLRVCILLALTIAYFAAQLFVSHLTHALTLLVDSYHVLCNIIALVGCIITIKYGRSGSDCNGSQESSLKTGSEELKVLSTPLGSVKFAPQDQYAQPERELRNTFGWARIDILVMLINCVFLASLCFSLLVEALQTLIHISHHDEMHHPIPVFCVGLVGILINILCYVMIGGYTYHQGSFLHVTESGEVVLESVSDKSVAYGQRRLSAQTRKAHVPLQPPKRQGVWETTRDIVGCVIVLLCSVIVYLTDKSVAKYVDPILSIVSALLLLYFSYPYMKESCLILLQTIPDHINIDSLETELLLKFKDIVNVHDFHVWQLTLDKTFSTVHIIFQNPHDYIRITDDITNFFHEHGITHVTVQPEFYKDLNSVDLVSGKGTAQCLVQCLREECYDSHCCTSKDDLRSISIQNLTSKKIIHEDEPVKILNIKSISDESFIIYDQTRTYQSCMDLENSRKTENTNGKLNGNMKNNGSLKGSMSVPDFEKKLNKTNKNLNKMINGNGYARKDTVENGNLIQNGGESRKHLKEIEEIVQPCGRNGDVSRKSENFDEKFEKSTGEKLQMTNSCSQTSINVIIRDAGEEAEDEATTENNTKESSQSESVIDEVSQSEKSIEKSVQSENEKMGNDDDK
ncbi:hypothetical protein LSTR_LSTR012465 [Laodelphax striatellus]|uniref:Zinc transporter 1 n=1 Tax=Laodelphax striatellus TaxID=195883 RepID=A0A482XSK2_LAOST|nr:hypothetical protein LSTR_LSTR012465 [Laodelphax striatellus]